MPAFRNRPDFHTPVYKADALPETERLSKQTLRLPTFSSATQESLDEYGMAFEKVLSHAEEIRDHRR